MGLPRDVRLHRRDLAAAGDGVRYRHGSGPVTVTAVLVGAGDPGPVPRGGVSSRRAVGFAIGKAVGSAVVRNQVRRRLRVGVRSLLSDTSLVWPDGETLVVVRVSPGAAMLDSVALHSHLGRAMSRVVARAAAGRAGAPSAARRPTAPATSLGGRG